MPPIRPRMSAIIEPASEKTRFVVIVEDCPLHGGLVDGHVTKVIANGGEDAIRTADGGASGIPSLDDQQTGLTV